MKKLLVLALVFCAATAFGAQMGTVNTVSELVASINPNGVNTNWFVREINATVSWHPASTETTNASPLGPFVSTKGTGRWIVSQRFDVVTVPTIADLPKLDSVQRTNRIIVSGYYTPGDGGGGEFFWDSDDTTTTNRGTIVSHPGTINGRYKRNIKGPLNVREFGAKGDGATDDSAFFQDAIAQAAAIKSSLFIPAGTYYVSTPVTLTNWMAIYGEPVDPGYKGAVPRRSVIKTTGAYNAFQTVRLTAPANTLANWARYIVLRDLYFVGPYLQATAVDNCVGVDITGAFDCHFENLHAEGFGTGFVFRNMASVYTKGIYAQNCFLGMLVGRDPTVGPLVYDGIGTFNNTDLNNNVLSLVLDNPRAVWFHGGQIINNLTNAVPKISITNCADDVQIHFRSVAMENQAVHPLIQSDESGFGILELDGCALGVGSYLAPVVETDGYFDLIKITGCQFERSVITNHAPIVWAKEPITTQNNYIRANRILVENNHPSWFDSFIRNDQISSRPESDYFPSGYVNLNPLPNADHAEDGIISIAGDYSFVSDTLSGGIARTWWNTTTTNNVYTLLLNTNATRGIDQMYVTAVVYDNAGANIPLLNVQGWGPQGDWDRISQGKVGEWTHPTSGLKFSKWAWLVALKNPAQAANGLERVQLFNVYGVPSSNQFGLYRMSVYAPEQKNPGYIKPLLHAEIPSSGLEGFHKVGDVYWNDGTVDTTTPGWVCTAAGFPGTWRVIGNIYYTSSLTDDTVVRANGTSGAIESTSATMKDHGALWLAGATNTFMLRVQNQATASTAYIQLSDNVDYAAYFGLNPVSNFSWIGENATHLQLLSGGDATLSGDFTADTVILDSNAADPGSPVDGQLWYNVTADEFRVRENGSTYPVFSRLRVTSSDTSSQYLSDKLVPGSNITFTTNNLGGVETITISAVTTNSSGTNAYVFVAPLTYVPDNVYIATNGIANNLLRQSAGVSVIGRAANSTGNVADISASANNQFLMRQANVVGFYDLPENLAVQKIRGMLDGSAIASRQEINFITGSNVVLSLVDNGGDDRMDLTINATGTGGGDTYVTNIYTTSTTTNIYTLADTVTIIADGDLNDYTGEADFYPTDSYSDVVFDATTMETDLLDQGDYIITATVQAHMRLKERVQIKLVYYDITETDLVGSEKTFEIASVDDYSGSWTFSTQGKVTVPVGGGYVKVQALAANDSPNTYLRCDRSTISWVKLGGGTPIDLAVNDLTVAGSISILSSGTSEIHAMQVTNNVSSILDVGDTDEIDMNKASATNNVTGAMTFVHATNGTHKVQSTHVRWLFNGSGSDQTLTIPAGGATGWRTNVYSPVPPAMTNDTITKLILTCVGPTDTAAKQTNCYVSFEYFK